MINELLLRLRGATRDARQRTGDQSLGVESRGGRARIVRVTYGATGAAAVAPVSDYADPESVILKLDAL